MAADQLRAHALRAYAAKLGVDHPETQSAAEAAAAAQANLVAPGLTRAPAELGAYLVDLLERRARAGTGLGRV